MCVSERLSFFFEVNLHGSGIDTGIEILHGDGGRSKQERHFRPLIPEQFILQDSIDIFKPLLTFSNSYLRAFRILLCNELVFYNFKTSHIHKNLDCAISKGIQFNNTTNKNQALRFEFLTILLIQLNSHGNV